MAKEPGFPDISALTSDTDIYDADAQRVSLMTLHTAKGLEFNVVVIAGCEQGFIPFEKPQSTSDPLDIEEERRLFYVGMTRARERLYFSYATERVLYGKPVRRSLSSFIHSIDPHLICKEKSGKPKKRSYQRQLPFFG